MAWKLLHKYQACVELNEWLVIVYADKNIFHPDFFSALLALCCAQGWS